MQAWIFKKENWRSLLLESCKTIIIMKGFSLDNYVSMKRMLLQYCHMGMKNPNVFNTVLPAKHKAQKCWFTESRLLREMVAALLDWPKPKTSDSQKRNEVWSLRGLYSHFQGNKPLDNKKERAREAPEWSILSSRAPRYSFYTAWSRAGLGLGNMQNPMWTL